MSRWRFLVLFIQLIIHGLHALGLPMVLGEALDGLPARESPGAVAVVVAGLVPWDLDVGHAVPQDVEQEHHGAVGAPGAEAQRVDLAAGGQEAAALVDGEGSDVDALLGLVTLPVEGAEGRVFALNGGVVVD